MLCWQHKFKFHILMLSFSELFLNDGDSLFQGFNNKISIVVSYHSSNSPDRCTGLLSFIFFFFVFAILNACPLLMICLSCAGKSE